MMWTLRAPALWLWPLIAILLWAPVAEAKKKKTSKKPAPKGRKESVLDAKTTKKTGDSKDNRKET